ncbi:MAG TPA: LysR substrate-binding domain-containing protein [Vicinamibacterales bacterium]|nr:LysR substrate-binding domain-containing protein [Vicinamibacterales bacterium]
MAVWDTIPYSLRQLQYLVAVADLGGFRRAAEACGVAQPSMSAQIAQAEQALGVQIFERGPRGARVTSAGAPVIERARSVLLASRDLAETARQHSDPLRGTARIGVIPTVCPYLLPEIAPALRARLADLHIVWSEDKTHALIEQVENGDIDGAILALDDRVAQLDHAVIGDDPFVLASAPGHRLAKRTGPASPDVLEGETVFLLEDGHCFRDQALALCGATGAHEADLKATGLSTLVQMVGGGDGVTLLPKIALAVENRRGQLAVRAFKSPAPTRTLVLVWRKGSAMKRPLDAMASVIRKAWPKT